MIGASKKLLQATAGNAGGAGLDITDVFSTYLYTGNGSSQTITNGIDLDGEGGLVWAKMRGLTRDHALVDTERGVRRNLKSNTSDAEGVAWGDNVNAFYSNGFLVGPDGSVNTSSEDYASWTFRKTPKFFDVVTYTGDGVAGRTVSHNLGSVPGFYVIKRTDSSGDWRAYHRSTGAGKFFYLNSTLQVLSDTDIWNNTAPTDSVFTLGNQNSQNINGATYVAYLFAHNDGDGGFGPNGSDIIKCGSYTGNGSTDGPEIDLGFEPQWVMIKSTSRTGDWTIFDSLRGVPTGGNDPRLHPNTNQVESSSADIIDFNSTGFKLTNTFGDYNGNGETYIYMAIRRGPLAPPESGTEVFDVDAPVDTSSGHPQTISTGFPVDMSLSRAYTSGVTASNYVFDRMRGGGVNLQTNSTTAEGTGGPQLFDRNTSIGNNFWGWNGVVFWNFRRAPGFFDVVAYTGDGVAGRTVSHNLGVAPEMLIVKSRSNTGQWRTYVEALGPTKYLELQSTSAAATSTLPWNDTAPTATDFTLGATTSGNASGQNYIAYLFATLPGISKVGSYTGDGTTDGSKIIDCGFTSGARFVLIKKSDGGGSWYVWDTARGIVAGNDPRLELNSTNAEASFDNVDPHSSGFSVVGSSINNINGASYIFYAIA